MPQSLSNILLHIIFSTKNRERLIPAEVTSDLYCYLAAISANHGCTAYQIGGTEDHIHICCSLARTQTCAKLVEEIKTGSSKWLKAKNVPGSSFAWQNGYGVFSIGEEQLACLKEYIANQPLHHTQITFAEELRGLLQQYHVRYDERYMWD